MGAAIILAQDERFIGICSTEGKIPESGCDRSLGCGSVFTDDPGSLCVPPEKGDGFCESAGGNLAFSR